MPEPIRIDVTPSEHVVAPDVDGLFGLKIHTFGDEIAATAGAMVLGRPVKFIADRLESFVSDIHARENLIGCEQD